MIHRKWSLLTGPPAILGGIIATIVVANLIFVRKSKCIFCNSEHYLRKLSPKDPFLKPDQKKSEAQTSMK